MSESKDKVNSLLLEFEMYGITERQKNVLSKAIKLLVDKAAGERDALELVDLQRMQKRLNDIKLNRSVNIFDYLNAVFIEGQPITFIFFDFVGIILFFFPSVGQSLINDVTLTRVVGGSIFFVSFLWANYNLYKKLS